jgi:hypothetical protein
MRACGFNTYILSSCTLNKLFLSLLRKSFLICLSLLSDAGVLKLKSYWMKRIRKLLALSKKVFTSIWGTKR